MHLCVTSEPPGTPCGLILCTTRSCWKVTLVSSWLILAFVFLPSPRLVASPYNGCLTALRAVPWLPRLCLVLVVAVFGVCHVVTPWCASLCVSSVFFFLPCVPPPSLWPALTGVLHVSCVALFDVLILFFLVLCLWLTFHLLFLHFFFRSLLLCFALCHNSCAVECTSVCSDATRDLLYWGFTEIDLVSTVRVSYF
ncbi:unnamed protein product [Discosporangium mesarthrocarpum]